LQGLQLAGSATLVPPAAFATERAAKVEGYPPFGSLVPIYGIFNLARATADAGTDSKKLLAVRPRYTRLTDQDLDAYRLVCTAYIGQINYVDAEKAVSFDKAARFKACDEALKAVGVIRDLLNKGVQDGVPEQVQTIGKNMGGFLQLLPKPDFEKAKALSDKLRAVDTDKDGKVSDEEVQFFQSGAKPLSSEEIETVKALQFVGLKDLLIP